MPGGGITYVYVAGWNRRLEFDLKAAAAGRCGCWPGERGGSGGLNKRREGGDRSVGDALDYK